MTGLDAVSLQPAAGSQGELTGLMLVRAYFADRGEIEQRRKVVIPDTAHGTNPASVTMAGFELTPVKTDARGNIDVEDLRGKVDEHDGRAHAHEPVDARAVRREHRGDRARSSTAPARSCTTTARTSTPSAASRGPATWASTSCTSTCTRRSRSRTAAAAPAAARSRCAKMLEPFLPVPAVVRNEDGAFAPRLRPAEDDRQGARLHRAVRRLRPLVRVHPHVRAAACARCRRRRC